MDGGDRLPWVALATDLRDVMNGQSLPPMVGDLWRLNIGRRPDRFGLIRFK